MTNSALSPWRRAMAPAGPTLDPDADQPAADIALRPEQVIHGRLFDLQGQPARDVKLSVTAIRRVIPNAANPRRDGFEGPFFWWAHSDDLPGWPRPVTTGADGRFTLHGVGPGLRVFLAVHDPRFANQMLAVETDAASAAKPMSLVLQAARTITGRVTYADTGKPAPHARVVVSGFDQDQVGVGPSPRRLPGRRRRAVPRRCGQGRSRRRVRLFARRSTLLDRLRAHRPGRKARLRRPSTWRCPGARRSAARSPSKALVRPSSVPW